jgi:hypothetical protein
MARRSWFLAAGPGGTICCRKAWWRVSPGDQPGCPGRWHAIIHQATGSGSQASRYDLMEGLRDRCGPIRRQPALGNNRRSILLSGSNPPGRWTGSKISPKPRRNYEVLAIFFMVLYAVILWFITVNNPTAFPYSTLERNIYSCCASCWR